MSDTRQLFCGIKAPHKAHEWFTGRGYEFAENTHWCPGVTDMRLDDPLEGANCHFCGETADNFHVPDDLWAKVEKLLGQHQACFKCFRKAAWYVGVKPDRWEVSIPRAEPQRLFVVSVTPWNEIPEGRTLVVPEGS